MIVVVGIVLIVVFCEPMIRPVMIAATTIRSMKIIERQRQAHGGEQTHNPVALDLNKLISLAVTSLLLILP